MIELPIAETFARMTVTATATIPRKYLGAVMLPQLNSLLIRRGAGLTARRTIYNEIRSECQGKNRWNFHGCTGFANGFNMSSNPELREAGLNGIHNRIARSHAASNDRIFPAVTTAFG